MMLPKLTIDPHAETYAVLTRFQNCRTKVPQGPERVQRHQRRVNGRRRETGPHQDSAVVVRRFQEAR